jgi:hypothetical protein
VVATETTDQRWCAVVCERRPGLPGWDGMGNCFCCQLDRSVRLLLAFGARVGDWSTKTWGESFVIRYLLERRLRRRWSRRRQVSCLSERRWALLRVGSFVGGCCA